MDISADESITQEAEAIYSQTKKNYVPSKYTIVVCLQEHTITVGTGRFTPSPL